MAADRQRISETERPEFTEADAYQRLLDLRRRPGVKMFSYRRVKSDKRDTADLADLLRLGRLPEVWTAPPATRQLRG